MFYFFLLAICVCLAAVVATVTYWVLTNFEVIIRTVSFIVTNTNF